VHNDDRDCDALAADSDCNDLCAMGSTNCPIDRNSFCNTLDTCALGCMHNGLCAASVCMPDAVCSELCFNQLSFAAKVECAFLLTPHLELYVDLEQNTGLCALRYEFSPGVPCLWPVIEYSTAGFETKYMPVITPGVDPNKCSLTVKNGTLADGEWYHLLISFAPANLGPRPTVMIGFQNSGNAQCVTPGYKVTYPSSPSTFTCQ
jgi:hypothetical protein